MRRATSVTIHQSGLASPGAGRNARWREMRRSELVTVPSFSPQAAAGRRTCAPASTVSLVRTFSDSTNSSSLPSASRTRLARGSETAGFVAITHSALILPRAIASNMGTALRPSRMAMRGACQNRRRRSTSCGANAMWAASWLARPPTSRPPMALGWPVNENGPWPRRPMRPVARWQLMMALTLSVPCADWFTPCEKQVTVLEMERKRSKKRATSAGGSRVVLAVAARSGAISRAPASVFSKAVVCASM